MAEERLIELGIVSASNLKDVNYISKMETYAVLTFPPYVEYTTQVDSKGGSNPRWDEKLGFLVPESLLHRGEANIKVEVFTLSTLGPKFVSEASIPISDISAISQFNDPIYKRYPLKTNSGDYHGDLHVSFAIGEKMVLHKKGEHPPSYPIVTKFSPPASGRPTYDTQQSSYPTPPSKPSHVRFNLDPSTPTKPSKFSKPPQYESDTPFQPSQFQPTTYFTDRPSSKTPPTPLSPPSPTYRPAKPTPSSYFEPSKPHPLPENYETFPPSYGDPFSSKPLKPLSQPSTFTQQQPPYGVPYEGGDSISYSPIKPPARAPPKFVGTHGGTVPIPISRIDEPSPDQGGYGYGDDYPMKTSPKFGTQRVNEPMGFGALDQGGYGHGADYPAVKPPPKIGTPRMNVPISKMDEESMKFPSFDQSGYGHGTKYGHQAPTSAAPNHLFGSPLGKILLGEITKSTSYDRRY